MPEPLDFQIIQNLQTALRGISKTATPPFHHTVMTLAVKLDPDHSVEDLIDNAPARPFMILELPPDGPWEYFPDDQLVATIPFMVHFVNDSDPTLDDSLLKEYLRLCADVEQAIAADHDRGGLATDTRITLRAMHELQGQLVWAIITGEIREHRKYGAPNG